MPALRGISLEKQPPNVFPGTRACSSGIRAGAQRRAGEPGRVPLTRTRATTVGALVVCVYLIRTREKAEVYSEVNKP